VKRGQLEARVLTLVTLGLVAFGLVMVYSATSASATLANGDPAYFLKRQAGYALLGLVLMVAASRLDYRVLRRLAPALVVTSLSLLLAVLVLGQAVNGARRWITLGPLVFQPSELAKLALAVWAASYLTRRRPPQTLKQLWRPIGLLATVFCVLLLAEPDLGTAITILLMLAGMLLVACGGDHRDQAVPATATANDEPAPVVAPLPPGVGEVDVDRRERARPEEARREEPPVAVDHDEVPVAALLRLGADRLREGAPLLDGDEGPVGERPRERERKPAMPGADLELDRPRRWPQQGLPIRREIERDRRLVLLGEDHSRASLPW